MPPMRYIAMMFCCACAMPMSPSCDTMPPRDTMRHEDAPRADAEFVYSLFILGYYSLLLLLFIFYSLFHYSFIMS